MFKWIKRQDPVEVLLGCGFVGCFVIAATIAISIVAVGCNSSGQQSVTLQ